MQTIITVSTKDNEKTIYSCLKSIHHQFDCIFIIDDGSKDDTCYEVNKLIRREHAKNIFVYDMSHIRLWTTLSFDEETESSRRIVKEFSLVSKFRNPMIWVSINPLSKLNEDARSIILNDAMLSLQNNMDHNFYKTSTGNRCAMTMLLPSKLFPGPESCSKTSPCLYVKKDNIVKKASFDEKNYSKTSIGVDI